MVIKNKNGSIYQLKKPNPLVVNQDMTQENVSIHNLHVDEVIIRYIPPKKKVVLNEMPVTVGAIDLPEAIESQPVTQPIKEEEGLSCWCLPGEIKSQKDSLYYGEERYSTVWGEKFTFNAEIVEMNEMSYKVLSSKKINPPSIIFIRENKRWWEVIKTEDKGGKFLITCIPSDLRPSFD